MSPGTGMAVLSRHWYRMAEGVENVIISMYAKGMSNHDIGEQIRELYDINVSASTISRVTDAVSEDIVAWRNRPLDPVYLIVWMDGISFKVRENSKGGQQDRLHCRRVKDQRVKRGLGALAGEKRISGLLDGCTHRYEGSGCRGHPDHGHR
nr:transposase [Echinicola rosea]